MMTVERMAAIRNLRDTDWGAFISAIYSENAENARRIADETRWAEPDGRVNEISRTSRDILSLIMFGMTRAVSPLPVHAVSSGTNGDRPMKRHPNNLTAVMRERGILRSLRMVLANIFACRVCRGSRVVEIGDSIIPCLRCSNRRK